MQNALKTANVYVIGQQQAEQQFGLITVFLFGGGGCGGGGGGGGGVGAAAAAAGKEKIMHSDK